MTPSTQILVSELIFQLGPCSVCRNDRRNIQEETSIQETPAVRKQSHVLHATSCGYTAIVDHDPSAQTEPSASTSSAPTPESPDCGGTRGGWMVSSKVNSLRPQGTILTSVPTSQGVSRKCQARGALASKVNQRILQSASGH